jgi:transcriptional regulator with XRE-family HTH domain
MNRFQRAHEIQDALFGSIRLFYRVIRLSGKMGISQAAYSQMERPKARLRRATLEKIASALDVEIGQLKIRRRICHAL